VINISTGTTTDETKFDFTGCFYHVSNDCSREICNVTVACAIILVLLGSFQGACDRQELIDEITTIARDNEKDPKTKTTIIRGKLGNLMKYNVSVGSLLPIGSTTDGIAVDAITQLYHYHVLEPRELNLISYLLAYFNLPNTIKPRYRADIPRYAKSHCYFLYTVLYITSNTFQTGYDRSYLMLPFNGTDIHGEEYKAISDLIISTAKLEDKDRKVIASCLTDIEIAINQINATRITSEINDESISDLYGYDDRYNNLKRIFKKHPYTILFVIAVAALSAGVAIALTTHFHVGTSLMLSAGFIPFLNFVGGFQISLLLGVVTAATACAGIATLVKEKPECCKPRCCNNKREHLLASEEFQTLH
jgi:hypothetical protein